MTLLDVVVLAGALFVFYHLAPIVVERFRNK